MKGLIILTLLPFNAMASGDSNEAVDKIMTGVILAIIYVAFRYFYSKYKNDKS